MPFNFRINDDKSLTFYGRDKEYRKYLQEIIDKRGTYYAECEFINEYFHEKLEIVDAEINGDLTDGLIFTDQTHDWWDSNCAIRSFLEDLFRDGKVTIEYARPNRYIFDDSISAVDWLNTHPHVDGFYCVYAKEPMVIWDTPEVSKALFADVSHLKSIRLYIEGYDAFICDIPRKELEYVDWGEERDAIIQLAQRVSDFAYVIKCVASDHNLFNFIVEHY